MGVEIAKALEGIINLGTASSEWAHKFPVTHKFLGSTAIGLGSELNSRRLKIVLVDAPRQTTWQGQRLRAVEDKNPGWYSEMYTGDGFRRYRVLPAISRVASSTDRTYFPNRRNSNRLELDIRTICFNRLILGFKEEFDPQMQGFVYGSNTEVCEELGLEPVEGDDRPCIDLFDSQSDQMPTMLDDF